ncbi:MAG: cell division protein ZapA [Hyphomicrobium sp.]
MAQVSIALGQRTYGFACSDAEAEHLKKLAAYVKETIDRLAGEHGAVGDERLILMAALTLTDELFEARADIDDLLDDQTEPSEDVDEEADAADDGLTRALRAQFAKRG